MTENTSEELKKLVDLPGKELLKEYTEARERFRKFLKASGINVPDIIIDNTAAPSFASGQKSILLDEFSGESISSIDDTVLTVYSTVEAFLKLFEKIVASDVLEDITVTVEGRDPCTAKDLKEQVEAGKVAKDGQIVVASSDLKMLLPDLGYQAKESPKQEKTSKAAVLSESDIKGIFEQKDAQDAPQEEAKKEPVPTEKPKEQKSSGEFSPIITQKEYDELMGTAKAPPPPKDAQEKTAEAEASEAAEEAKPVPGQKTAEKAEAAPAPAAKAAEETKAPSAAKPAPAPKAAQKTESPKPAEKAPATPEAPPAPKKAESDSTLLSQSELDALLSSKPAEKASAPAPKDNAQAASPSAVSQDEIDNLLKGKSSAETTAPAPEAAAVSQDEIDNLLKGKSSAETTAPAPEATAVSQDEIDNLLNQGNAKKAATTEEKADISQDELDALFASKAATPKAADKKEEKTAEASAVSQSEIDALLNAGSAKKTEAPVVSQDEINELLKKPAEPIKQQIGDTSANGASIASQSEVDALLAILSKTEKRENKNAETEATAGKPEKPTVSQDELDALFAASKAKDKK